MRTLALPLVIAAALTACAPTAVPSGNHSTGIVAWDRSGRTLYLNGSESFSVPADVRTNGMQNGDTVSVTWQQQGGQRVATSVRVERRRAEGEQR